MWPDPDSLTLIFDCLRAVGTMVSAVCALHQVMRAYRRRRRRSP